MIIENFYSLSTIRRCDCYRIANWYFSKSSRNKDVFKFSTRKSRITGHCTCKTNCFCSKPYSLWSTQEWYGSWKSTNKDSIIVIKVISFTVVCGNLIVVIPYKYTVYISLQVSCNWRYSRTFEFLNFTSKTSAASTFKIKVDSITNRVTNSTINHFNLINSSLCNCLYTR